MTGYLNNLPFEVETELCSDPLERPHLPLAGISIRCRR